VGPDHLSRLELGESGRDVDDQLRYEIFSKLKLLLITCMTLTYFF
jgi:hypothetical protein